MSQLLQSVAVGRCHQELVIVTVTGSGSGGAAGVRGASGACRMGAGRGVALGWGRGEEGAVGAGVARGSGIGIAAAVGDAEGAGRSAGIAWRPTISPTATAPMTPVATIQPRFTAMRTFIAAVRRWSARPRAGTPVG